MTEQILDIDPVRTLVFEGAFTNVVTSHLTLTNNKDRQICFKVKTTAPKQYCVKPNSGILAPGDTKKVKLMLQPTEAPIDGKAHKFMIQAAYSDDANVDVDQFWKETHLSKITSTKLAVNLINKPAEDSHVQEVEGTEEFAAVNHVGQSQATPVSVPKSGEAGSEDMTAALRRERADLLQKVKALEAANSNLASTNITNLQIILIAVAALLVGLIIGKLF